MRIGSQGRRAQPEHSTASGFLVLVVRRPGTHVADAAGRDQAHLARRMDELVLRSSRTGRTQRGRRASTRAGRARCAHHRTGADAARLSLSGGHGRRHGRERDMPRVRRASCCPRPNRTPRRWLRCVGCRTTTCPPRWLRSRRSTARGCASSCKSWRVEGGRHNPHPP